MQRIFNNYFPTAQLKLFPGQTDNPFNKVVGRGQGVAKNDDVAALRGLKVITYRLGKNSFATVVIGQHGTAADDVGLGHKSIDDDKNNKGQGNGLNKI